MLQPFDIDLDALTLTVRDPSLFDEAESIAHRIASGYTSRTTGWLLIRCANAEKLALLAKMLADCGSRHVGTRQERQELPKKKIRYAEWIRLDSNGIVRLGVHAIHSVALQAFLQAKCLQFQCAVKASGQCELTFAVGITVWQVHAALTEFDKL